MPSMTITWGKEGENINVSVEGTPFESVVDRINLLDRIVSFLIRFAEALGERSLGPVQLPSDSQTTLEAGHAAQLEAKP